MNKIRYELSARSAVELLISKKRLPFLRISIALIFILISTSACVNTQLRHIDYKSLTELPPCSIDGLWVFESDYMTADNIKGAVKTNADDVQLFLSIRRGVAYIEKANNPELFPGAVFFKDIRLRNEKEYSAVFVRGVSLGTKEKGPEIKAWIEVLSKDLIRFHCNFENFSIYSTYRKKDLDDADWFLAEHFPTQSITPIVKKSSIPIVTNIGEQRNNQVVDANSEMDYIATSGVNYGLIIGIDHYTHLDKLNTAINDAKSVANILHQKYGYRVKRLLNPVRDEIIAALSYYRKHLTKDDILLIYYAGHGWLDREADEGYWLPSDATLDNESNWIANSAVTASLRAMDAKQILIVADSCYAGKLTRAIHISPRNVNYHSRLSQKIARVVMTSGGLEPVLDSGIDKNHSVFASAFIKALSENNKVLSGNELFEIVRRRVMLESDQVPEYSDIRKAGHDGGDFIFNVRN